MAQPTPDTAIVSEARQLYRSPLIAQIRAAYKSGKPVTLKIGKYTVQYEHRPFSGMTSFGLKGFIIGKEAFKSESEFKKTLLHELYRLHRSALAKGGGVDKHSAQDETKAAFQFAERFHSSL